MEVNGGDWFAAYIANLASAVGEAWPKPQPTPDGFLVPPGNGQAVRKLSAAIKVPDELAMDLGIIPDTRPKPPPPSWRTRLRWKRDDWRERTARRAFKIIAGYDVPGAEDW